MATVFFPMIDAAPIELPLRRFDADEYLAMARAGFFDDGPRVELIDGYIVDMSPAGPEHNYVVMQLNELFAPLLGQFKLWIQGTLKIASGHVFDPDFALLKRRPRHYKHELPTPDDVSLIAEVADTSRNRDMTVKLPVYSNTGIAEYWIADVTREVLIVHRGPMNGKYNDVTEYAGDESISPLAAPNLKILAREVFSEAAE